MTPITTTKAKLLFVEVPGNSTSLFVDNDGDLIYWFPVSENNFDVAWIELPSGSTYTFLFTTKQATEEDWKGVVDGGWYSINGAKSIGYVDYSRREGSLADLLCDTATESGLSLQQANGMDVNKNYAVIKID